jgi:CubicO group peptidase (beta-lactamase class C family)
MAEVEQLALAAIQSKTFPGCVIGTIRLPTPAGALAGGQAGANGSREVRAFGRLTYDVDAPVVAEDTVYDLASITKSIPTASLALIFAAEGKLSLKDTVKTHIPELRNDYGATVEDLLRYRVRGVRMSTLKDKSAEELSAYIFSHGFDAPPGESRYTNLPTFLLGLVLERVSGVPLAQLARERVFEPFDMRETGYSPLGEYNDISLYSIAPTEVDASGEIRGVPHDESARVFAREHRAVGHAGLFSTAPDLLTFLGALLGGRYPQVSEGAQAGLGWQVRGGFLGKHAGSRTFGKTGFTGTSVVCDIERGVGLVILSNRTYPERPRTTEAIDTFRSRVADILLE